FGIMSLWILGSTMLTYYYTEIVGISAGLVGTIIFLSRIFDGISDVAMGYVVDNTRSKHGKARPWLLWLAVPFSISGILVFSVPDIGTTGQVVYAVITNLLFILMYTGIRIPYNALIALMSNDSQERGMMSIYQMVPGFTAGMVVSIAFIPLFNMLGGTRISWFLLVLILSVMAGSFIYVTFRSTKERVGSHNESDVKTKVSFITGLKVLLGNKFWVLIFLVGLLMSALNAMSSAGGLYYALYVFGDVNLIALIGAATSLPVLVSLFFIAPLVKKFGKRNAALGGAFLGIIGGIIKIVDPSNLVIYMTGSVLQTIGTVPVLGIGIALLADTIEYGEWKTGIRTEGLATSGGMFADKLGNGLGTAIVGWTLALGGYVAGAAEQSESVI
ncbi:glycoside-pentoside-hexuronide (GPH):cation symporter, partial [Bacillus sp. JJ353]